MLIGGAKVENLNLFQKGEGFKLSYMQPMCNLPNLR
jgi:hypothetical protein